LVTVSAVIVLICRTAVGASASSANVHGMSGVVRSASQPSASPAARPAARPTYTSVSREGENRRATAIASACGRYGAGA